jgi:spermidine synthase
MSHGYGFPDMATIIPEGKRGEAEVQHMIISSLQSQMSSYHGAMNYVEEGTYAKLLVGGKLVMTDTRHERITNREIVRRAHGRVLIGGLGLGMILVPILAKEAVEMVLVIEKSQDVIDLIWHHIEHSKLTVRQGDVFTWDEKYWRGRRFNCVYMDIWPGRSEQNLPQIAKLHQKYKYYLDRSDPDCWMGSWEQNTLRSQKRQYA